MLGQLPLCRAAGWPGMCWRRAASYALLLVRRWQARRYAALAAMHSLVCSICLCPCRALAIARSGACCSARWVGRRIVVVAGRAQGLGELTMVVAVVLALALASITVLQPLYGVAIFFLLASPGLGAAILSRGGIAMPLSVA